MNDSSMHKLLADLFRSTIDSGCSAEGEHFIDDDELLISWSVGELNQEQHAALVNHMAACSYCRREVSAMIQAGALVLPEARQQATVKAAPEKDSSRRDFRPPRRGRLLAVLAVAASLLTAIWVWGPSASGPEELLAQAERDLKAGDALSAFEAMEGLLQRELAANIKNQAESLFEESGYQLARNSLESSDFSLVAGMEQRISNRAVVSPRMLNLKLQAKRGIPAEYALAQLGTLSDYGYDISGLATKSFTIDPASERLDKEISQTLVDHPNAQTLLLNYGQFLLEQEEFAKARQQFEAVLSEDAQNTLALLGQGLVEFEQEKYEAALRNFENVLQFKPNHLAAHINAAMSCESLERWLEAREHWQRAAKLTTDGNLREQIEIHVKEMN